MDINALLTQYAAGPRVLREACAGLNAEQLRARPVPGTWSILEVVCHLADFEPIGADRMKRVLAEPEPTLLGADEALFAQRLAYHERDLLEELQLIEGTRNSLMRILRTVTDAEWQRIGHHDQAGPLTLLGLLERMTNHLPHHLNFLREKRRALGV